jgi:hypothetical protein
MKPESDFAQSDLDYTLAMLAAEHRAERAPHTVERAVLAEFDAARPRRVWKIAAAGAIAALLVAGAFSIHRPKDISRPAESRIIAPAPMPIAEPVKSDRPTVRRHSPKPAVSPQPTPEADPFIAIPYTVPLAPEERATVVRMTLSAAAMAAVGFPFQPGVPQQADVLISEDGRARAIRIVANSDYR